MACRRLAVVGIVVLAAGWDARAAEKPIPVRAQPTRAFAGIGPSGWQAPSFDDRGWKVAPGLLVPRAGVKPGAVVPPGVTALDMVPAGPLYTRTRFDVDGPASARVLELRITYQDGFVAFLNGTEVARRNVPPSPADARATVVHGADAERIFLPLPLPAPGATLLAKDNVLAVELRSGAGRLPLDANAPSGRIEIGAASGVQFVRGPYLIAPTDGAVTVAWETDLPARGTLRYWPDGAPAGDNRSRGQLVPAAKSVAAAKADLRQALRLTGLAPGTRYQYQVHVEGPAAADRAQSAPSSFETAPARDRPVRFVVYGDMRAPGHAAHAQVVGGILRERASLIVNTGDLVAVGGEESAWQRYFEITAPLGATAPVVPALGNHESYLGGTARSWALFGLKSASPVAGTGYSSFDWGGLHFVILDSNRPDAAQRKWLVQDLAAAKRLRPRAIFAVCHGGPWSHGPHGGSRTMEKEFAPVLAAAGVDVLFTGHDHLYERGVGVTAQGLLPYVISGGGGAPLYNPTCQPASGPATPAVVAPTPSGGTTGALPGAGAPMPLPACPPSVAAISKTYHYVVVEIDDRNLRICPRLPDGGPIEPCVQIPLRAPARRR